MKPLTLMERCIALAKGVPDSKELKRIIDLPRRDLVLETVPDVTEAFSIPGGSIKLWPIQSAALLEIEKVRGGLFPIGVGHGKSLISLLASEVLDSQRPVILVPPSLKTKLIEHDIPFYSQHFKFRTPHVVAYSELSSAGSAGILDELNPDLIVADEAHSLARSTAARTRRFIRYMTKNLGCAFVALSGTMTAKSLRDYAHLSELALKDRSPLPTEWGVLEDWCTALDPGDFSARPGALQKLCEDKGHDHSNGVRGVFRCRLVSSHGVVATEESALGTSLTIRSRIPRITERESAANSSRGSGGSTFNTPSLRGSNTGEQTADDGREAVNPHNVNADVAVVDTSDSAKHNVDRFLLPSREALEKFRETWTRPDGEEIEEAARFHQIAQQLAQGFYYRWAWPEGQVDHDWLQARSDWHREVRNYLSNRSAPGRDSPGLLAGLAERGEWQAPTYPAWRAVKDRKPPPVEVVWLSDYLISDAAEWIKGGGIVWVTSPAFGEALHRVCKAPYFGAGDDEILSTTSPAIIASVSAHGIGKNLQRYSRMLFVGLPGNKLLEQAIARCHRPGQKTDEVTVDIYLHTEELRQRWKTVIKEAKYVQESTGQKQKVLMAALIDLDKEQSTLKNTEKF